jgi:hypothetical protein
MFGIECVGFVVAAPRRSTSSLGVRVVTVHLRVFTAVLSFFFALAACHRDLRIVRIDVFEDHVSIDGVVSNLPIQQAVDGRAQDPNVFVLITAKQSLSAPRTDELRRSADKLYLSSGVGIRRVQFECSKSPGTACP